MLRCQKISHPNNPYSINGKVNTKPREEKKKAENLSAFSLDHLKAELVLNKGFRISKQMG
jgi:hypothetical protein